MSFVQISGLRNENIRQKLLSEELDFDKASELALLLEQAEKQSGILQVSDITNDNLNLL